MHKLITTSAFALMLSTGAALAQAQTPAAAPAAKQAAPAPTTTTTAAPTAQPTAQPQRPTASASVSLARGAAASPVEAKQIAEAKLRERQQTCSAKGPAYRWKPPHVAGDPNPKGGFYTSNYAGGCGMVSMKEALTLGIVTVNPSAPRN